LRYITNGSNNRVRITSVIIGIDLIFNISIGANNKIIIWLLIREFNQNQIPNLTLKILVKIQKSHSMNYTYGKLKIGFYVRKVVVSFLLLAPKC